MAKNVRPPTGGGNAARWTDGSELPDEEAHRLSVRGEQRPAFDLTLAASHALSAQAKRASGESADVGAATTLAGDLAHDLDVTATHLETSRPPTPSAATAATPVGGALARSIARCIAVNEEAGATVGLAADVTLVLAVMLRGDERTRTLAAKWVREAVGTQDANPGPFDWVAERIHGVSFAALARALWRQLDVAREKGCDEVAALKYEALGLAEQATDIRRRNFRPLTRRRGAEIIAAALAQRLGRSDDRDALAESILRAMPADDGTRGDRMGNFDDELFPANVQSVIRAAFRTAGVEREIADKLFQAKRKRDKRREDRLAARRIHSKV